MPANIVKVLLVDDHPVVLTGIRSCLRDNKRISVVGQAMNAKEAVRRAKRLHPDIILLDIGLPDVNATDAIKMLQSALPTVRILIHTMHDDRELIREFIRLGARGYILKGCSPAQISLAIEAVNSNRIYLSPQVTKILNETLEQNLTGSKSSHSRRRKDGLQAHAKGKGNTRICCSRTENAGHCRKGLPPLQHAHNPLQAHLFKTRRSHSRRSGCEDPQREHLVTAESGNLREVRATGFNETGILSVHFDPQDARIHNGDHHERQQRRGYQTADGSERQRIPNACPFPHEQKRNQTSYRRQRGHHDRSNSY